MQFLCITDLRDAIMRSSLFCASLLLTASCSVEAEPVTPTSYSDYLKLLYQQTCEARLRCCSSLCSDLNDSTFYKLTARTQDYIARGYMSFDPQAAKECLESQRKRFESCDSPVPTTLSGCDRVLIPRSPVGGPCESGIAACMADGYCSGNRCIPTAKAGQTCALGSSLPCVASAYCQLVSSAYVCVAYLGVGQSCTTGGRCDPTQGLLCLPSGLCGPPLPLDAMCTQNAMCISGFCDPSSLTCKMNPLPVTLRQQLCAQPEPTPPM